ncbi:hypothetical protein ACFQNJ_10135 [Hydrogenophaga bisanensis]|uniref:Gam-like protein n=1 Tax=Hydrogenophaga bisanensis TaxID=439611 RepID=A0ABW2R9V4_9BURK
MNDITLFPADIAAMSVSQLAALPAAQKAEIDKNLDEALSWLKKARTKFDAALDAAYGEQARATLRDSGRDFGTAHIDDGPLRIKFELPKKVSWDQKKLGDIAAHIVASGDKVEHFIDVKLAVSESRFTNWPPSLQQKFAAARTVEPGKPSFTLSLDSEH